VANRWAPSILSSRWRSGSGRQTIVDTDSLKLALMATAYNADYGPSLTIASLRGHLRLGGVGYGLHRDWNHGPDSGLDDDAGELVRACVDSTTAYNVRRRNPPEANTNGHLYMVVTAGTTGGLSLSLATGRPFPVRTLRRTAVVYTEIGTSITKFSSGNIVSPSMSLTGIQYGWIYDAQNATAANQSLICLLDFGSQKTWTSTVVTFTPDANLGWVFLTPS
jgi:hypothetical protein